MANGEFACHILVTLSKYGGRGVTMSCKIDEHVTVSLSVPDTDACDAINRFIVKVTSVQTALDNIKVKS